MLTPGDKHLDHFWWGDAEQFHDLRDEADNILQLFDYVQIVKNNGITLQGQIGFINSDSVVVLL